MGCSRFGPVLVIGVLAACGRVGFDAAGAGEHDANPSAPQMCGNGVVEGTEACDDGNAISDDGCELDCAFTPTAFRVTTFELVDPHLYDDFFVITCQDITSDLNAEIANEIRDYFLNIVIVVRPSNPSWPNVAAEYVAEASCAEVGGAVTCGPGAASPAPTRVNRHDEAGPCLQLDPATLGYGPPLEPQAPCGVSEPFTGPAVGGRILDFHAENVTLAFEYDEASARLIRGLARAYLPEQEAMTSTFGPQAPTVGGDTLYEHLAAGRVTGSSCSNQDDRDNGTGFFMYMNFEAERVIWTP